MERTLYILMRTDIQDMNPGKAMAQAAHAQADFDAFAGTASDVVNSGLWQEVCAWREDRTFGRTIVLEASLEQINEVMSTVRYGGVTVDPTYPWRNYYGDVFLTSEITCAWVFVCDVNSEDKESLSHLKLHR